jgi:hypothetical protein
MAAPTAPTPRHSGLITFVGVLFLVVGAFNLIDGIVALVNDDYFAADELLFGDLSAWGVWWLIVGGAQFLTGAFLLARRALSGIYAITIAALNAVTQLMWLGTYPGWAIAAIAVDGLIIWAVTTRFEEFA